MKVIKTKADLLRLREESTLPKFYLDFLAKDFRNLAQGLGNGVPEDAFDLTEHGPMVLIEPRDDIRGSMLGLNPLDGGFLAAPWEYVETYDIGLGLNFLVTKIMVLADNDFAYLYYLPKGSHPDKEFETLVDEHSVFVNKPSPSILP